MRCGKDGCSCEEITGLNHIGVFVKDLEKSKDFYTNVLCFECYSECNIESDDGITKIAFVRRGSCIIELVEFPEYTKRSTDSVIAHIALNVTDIGLVQACLEKKGVKFDTEKPIELPIVFDNGVKYILFKGPDGEVIELNQIL